VRTIALAHTEGLARGMRVERTGEPIQVPVGPETLGRLFNVLGEPLDGRVPPTTMARWPIHHPAPSLAAQRHGLKFLETGIKVIDLLAPLARGGKAGLIGGAGVGKTVLLQELIRKRGKRDIVKSFWGKSALSRISWRKPSCPSGPWPIFPVTVTRPCGEPASDKKDLPQSPRRMRRTASTFGTPWTLRWPTQRKWIRHRSAWKTRLPMTAGATRSVSARRGSASGPEAV
jgi:hypothetical protein